MKKLLLLPLLLSNTLAQDFTTSVYEIGMHDRYVVSQTYVAPVVTIREGVKPSITYRQMSEELSKSLDASDQQIAANRQLYELRKQTRILQETADK
jgi:hypothetical protein